MRPPFWLLLTVAFLATPAIAQQAWPQYVAPEIQKLEAEEIMRLDAPEARQGVAVDAHSYYAVDNFQIAKYSRETGERLALWRGAQGGPFIHLNSCFVDQDELACAHSNYPHIPFANSVERFDKNTLQPTRSRSLGVMDEGSLVWFDHVPEGWIAGLAQYNGPSGLEFKDHTFAAINLYDADWRRIGGWTLPDSVLERIAPKSASGGAIGPGGYLYILGHDRPEMYVLGKPRSGSALMHVATIAINVEGQAFDFDESEPGTVCAISRPNHQVRCYRLPAVMNDPEHYKPFH